MMKFHRKAIALLALGAAVSLGACDSVERVTDVTHAPAYSYNHGSVKKWADWLRTAPSIGGLGMRVIDSKGGTLEVGGHKLIVPMRSVRHETLFIMRVLPGDNVHVELSAYRTSNNREVAEFDVPVKLVLSLAGADPADYDKARVAYLVDGSLSGNIDIVAGSVIDRDAQTITALLHHFSNYAVCID